MSFKKIPSLIKKLYKKFIEDELTAIGAQLTYYLILSFFPFLIFLISIISYTPVTQDIILENLNHLLPNNAYDSVATIINETLQHTSNTVLSFGMLFTLWAASNGVNAIMRGINKAYGIKEDRLFWKVKGLGIVFTLILMVTIIASLITLVFGEILGRKLFYALGFPSIYQQIWLILRYIFSVGFLVFAFIFIYRYMPNKQLRFKEVLPGALFSSVSWILASSFFSYYVNHFSHYSRIYGSIGGVIVLLIWLYLSSVIILIGGEINAVLNLNQKEPVKYSHFTKKSSFKGKV